MQIWRQGAQQHKRLSRPDCLRGKLTVHHLQPLWHIRPERANSFLRQKLDETCGKRGYTTGTLGTFAGIRREDAEADVGFCNLTINYSLGSTVTPVDFWGFQKLVNCFADGGILKELR